MDLSDDGALDDLRQKLNYGIEISPEEKALRAKLRRVLGKPLDAWQVDFLHAIRGHANEEMRVYLQTPRKKSTS
ncbi:MAG TPA: hypothetical protein PKW49_01065 [Paludibacteraceae bacterium]|nr:hypothetical protein [Paludibacteraceae bacterium]